MSNKHPIYLLGACILFVFIYSPAHLYFLSDDWDSLLFSLHPANLFHSFRPLSDASLLLDYSVWKMNAAGFHFTNIILHFACVFCVYQVAKLLFQKIYVPILSARSALLAAFLFLFYPFHSEALFWIVGRGAILCTLFGLLCLIFFIKKDARKIYFFLSFVCFVLSLFSYEEAWILPAIITIFSLFDNSSNKRKRMLHIAGFWVVFLLYLAGRFYFTHDIIGTPYGAERIVNFSPLFLCKNLAAFIFRSLIVPMQSSVVFSITCAVVAILFFMLLVSAGKKLNLVLLISAIFFLLSLLPVLPLGIDTHDTESERFLYFPSVFFIIFLVQFFKVVFRKIEWLYAIVVAGCIPLWFSYQSFVRSSIVSEKTVSSIGEIGSIDTVFASQLPDQYKGAFIFRNGFASMIRLIKKDSVQAVTILSKSELFQPANDYQIAFDTARSKGLGEPFQSNNLYIEWRENEMMVSRQSFKK